MSTLFPYTTLFRSIGMCEIGEDTLLGSGVHVLSGNKQHRFSDPDTPIQEQGGAFQKVRIGRDCWLGNNATVLTDLADKTLIAAGSVVTRPSACGDIFAGNPAKPLKNRFNLQTPQTPVTSNDQ